MSSWFDWLFGDDETATEEGYLKEEQEQRGGDEEGSAMADSGRRLKRLAQTRHKKRSNKRLTRYRSRSNTTNKEY